VDSEPEQARDHEQTVLGSGIRTRRSRWHR